ncbi:nucleoside monophosphate kinase [Catenuloplanes japonicus]|uniref:nucleoside monophosphate kinase n=1 Tax=Catenuloplanes japonicus TaxID=33876 RepID=UPI000524F55F|nr:nucleoside monophosphate kinase [Catenuloplanes japonicus]
MRKIAVIAEPGVLDAWAAAQLLGEARDVQARNVSDLIRDAVHRKTAWGRRFDEHLRAGELVPEEVTAEFVAEVLARERGGWVLYGYPRSVAQAVLLAAHGHEPDVVIEVSRPDGYVDRRLAEGRSVFALPRYRADAAPLHDVYRRDGRFRAVCQTGSFWQLAIELESCVFPSAPDGPGDQGGDHVVEGGGEIQAHGG